MLFFRTMEVDENNKVVIKLKQKSTPFPDFADYYNRLCDASGKLIENAKDKNRSKKYGVVTTISKGYDAPCCAAIAKKYGCDTAVTFYAKGKYAEDSGVEVAKALGYSNIVERDADEYLKRTDLCEAEQIASGEIGSDLCYVAFDDLFSNNVVFTGDRGDSIWARENAICNNWFAFDDMLSHLGNQERRLWIGFISNPMPLFGGSAWESIQALAQSEEMKPWVLGGSYDRPIPRRIVEEAGVKREQFGIQKHGSGFTYHFDWLGRIKKRMSPTAAEDFSRYVRANRTLHPIQAVRYFWRLRKLYIRALGIKVNSNMTGLDISREANAMAARYLFPWAGEIVQGKYKKALER